jgi:hypothetical protein
MAGIVREAARVVSIVGEFVSSRMPQRVRANGEGKLCSSPCALNHSQEPSCCDWRALLGREDVRALALQWSQPLDRARKKLRLLMPAWRGTVTFNRSREQSKPHEQIDEAIGDISGEGCASLRTI